MKGGGPLKRTTPLRAKTGLKRGKPLVAKKGLDRRSQLKTTTPLRTKPKPRKDELTRQAEEAWIVAVLGRCQRDRLRRYVCPACGRAFREGEMDGHHVTTQEVIRKYVRSLRLTRPEVAVKLRELLWDVRNGLAVCEGCHAAHTGGKRRLSVALVTDDARAFAVELGLERLLERYYRRERHGD